MGKVPGLEDLERSQLMRFAFGEALRIANDFYHETAGRTLINHWLPIVARESRYLFRSAVISPRRARQTLIVPRRGPSSSAVREWEAILEYVARLLSGDHLKGRRIHVDESRIPPGLRDRLKQRFAKVLSGNRPVQTEVIPRKPLVKEADSRHGPNITRTLDTPEHPDMTRSTLRREIFDTPPEQVKEYRKTPTESTQRKEPPSQKETSVGKTEQLPYVDREIYSFLSKLRPVELDFLRLFAKGPVSAIQCRKMIRQKGFLPYLLVDEINKKALETLGGVLLFEEEGLYSLDEEWGPQILRGLRDFPAGDQQTEKGGQSEGGEGEEPLSPSPQTDEPTDEVVEEMATGADEWKREEEQEETSAATSSPEVTSESPQTIPDWKTEPVEVANIRIFLAELTPEEREFFTLFQRKVVSYEECAAFTRARGLMLTSFIDGINETAMEFTGEIVLEEVDGNVVLTEEFTGLITLLEEETEG